METDSDRRFNWRDVEAVRDELRSRRDCTEETPFGPEVLVYKVRGKVFALLDWLSAPLTLALKCDPIHALQLRAEYPAVIPGYHLNKRHWNTVILDGSVPDAEVLAMIDESWRLVAQGLKKEDRSALGLG